MPVSKKELSTILNEELGTSISWDKLSKEDLDALFELFSTPAELSAKLVRGNLKSKITEAAGVATEALTERATGLVDRFESRPKLFPRLWGSKKDGQV